MTQYMFMLFDDESWHDNVSEESWMEAMQAHGAFAEAVEAAGARILDGNALEHTADRDDRAQRLGREGRSRPTDRSSRRRKPSAATT